MERHDALLEILRASRQQARQAGLAEAEQRAALRQNLIVARRDEQQQLEQDQARLAAARQARLEAQRTAEQNAEQQSTHREAAQQARLAERAEAERLASRQTQREAQREEEQAEAQRAAARLAKRGEQRASEAATQQIAARRAAGQVSRLAEQRDAEQDLAHAEARRAAAREARLAEQREAERASAQAEARRAPPRQANRDDQSAAGREAERAQALRQASRKARRSGQRAAERSAAQSEARRTALNNADRAARPRAEAQPPPPAHDPLQDRIPSGTLSGALPWLRVVGNRLVTLAGDPLPLRGVSLLGLERAAPHPQHGFAAGAGITAQTLDAILDWGVNIVRVAINQGRVLHGCADLSAWDYLADLDGIIQHAAARGAYTLLSLRQLDEATVFGTLPGPAGERLPNHIAPQPDYDTIGMWRLLGERYADEPAVLFDLYTAPHAPLADDLTGYDSDWDLWTLWVQLMVAELRRMHPRVICWVSGLADGTDLSGFPVLGTAGDPIPNLIYAVQLYPRRANPWPAMQALARTQPVFVTEWGGERAEVTWGERTALALRGSGIGWTAAHWNAEPFITRTAHGQITATPFGNVVQRALALAGEPLAAPRPVLPAALNALSIG
jgi:hypothetical protein